MSAEKSVVKSKNRGKDINKRNALNIQKKKTDIFVTNKSSFKEQLSLCEGTLNSEGEIVLHCVGRAINRGINLALTLIRNSGGALSYEANTNTIELIDDLKPVNDEDDFTIQKRMNSSLHVRVYNTLEDFKHQRAADKNV